MKDQVSDKTANEDEEEEAEEEGSEKPAEPIKRAKRADAFADAFEAAEKAVEPEKKTSGPKKAKPEPKAEAEADEGADDEPPAPLAKTAKKPAKQTKAEPEEEDEESDEATETGVAKSDKPKAEKPAAKPAEDKSKEPLKAKAYWSKERRDAFQYQPRHVQEAWLEEAAVPHSHWSEEQKAAFGKLPPEAKEMLLVQAQEIERGYGTKFQALANERKLAESVKAAITPEIREQMQKHGLDEAGTFSTLLKVQMRAIQDPYGYATDFIRGNNLDLNQIVRGFMAGDTGQGQHQPQQNSYQPPMQADISSHPAFRQMAADLDALKRTHAEANDRRISEDIDKVTAETDGDGNSLYPFIRILASPMAEIIESDPERFGSMDVRERFVTAYNMALSAFPELNRPAPKPQPLKADEPQADEPDTEDDEQDAKAAEDAEKLKKAATKKPKTPQSAPSKGGDPFERAFARAERQVGHR